MERPWDGAIGWEYDALRRLPDAVARRLWYRATAAAWRLLFTTRSGLALAVLVSILPILLTAVIWLAAWLLGWGAVWQLAAEMAFHLLLYRKYRRFVIWAKCEFWFPYMRPFVRVELFRYDPATYWRESLNETPSETPADTPGVRVGDRPNHPAPTI